MIAHCSQKHILSLLRSFRDWVADMSRAEVSPAEKKLKREANDDKSLWVFTLLLYLDPVMVAQHVSVVRELGRRCIELRNAKEAHDDSVIRLNMVITIVAKVFGQADLV